MNELSHTGKNKSDEDLVKLMLEAQHNLNRSLLGGENKTFEEAMSETDYFYASANAANVGRFEALSYAWRKDFMLRAVLFLWSFPCASVLMLSLMTMPLQHGVPRAMQVLGIFGTVPMLFGAVWLKHAWQAPRRHRAYEGRAAPLLLMASACLMAVGLLGTWLA